MDNITKEYLDTRTASYFLGISVSTMKRLRKSGEGAPFHRFGRSIRYTVPDLRAWAKDNQCRVSRSVVDF